MRVSLLLFTAVISCSTGTVLAQQLVIPTQAPFTTPADAENAFKERAALLIRMNACGRELDYVQRRDEIRKKNFDKEAQELTELLSAKIAWLNDPVLGKQTCEEKIIIPRPRKNPPPVSGNVFVDATASEFSNNTLNFWNDPSRPTNCQVMPKPIVLTENDLTITFQVTPDCMRRQVNEAIRAMGRDRQMGTDGLPCFFGPTAISRGFKGDFDINVRELTRLLYMGRIVGPLGKPVLDQSTKDYMYKNLLVAKGGLSAADYSVIAGCDDPAGDDASSPEDWADQEKWYNELLSALGDVLSWPFEVYVKVIGGLLVSGAAIDSIPLMLIAGQTASYPPLYDVRVPETENHRLMIESSKYLTNNAMLRELDAAGHDKSTLDAKRDEQKQVREWLLGELQRIAINDFDEYNSRPYTQYSLESILNLYDFSNLSGFSDDQEMCTASAIVLDLSASKFVAGSNRGRRIAPYRRRTYYDGTGVDDKGHPITTPLNLYNMTEGADHEVVRALLLAGQTQLLSGPNLPDDQRGVPAGQSGGAVNTAVSGYRLPDGLLKIVSDRDSDSTAFPFSQMISHAGIESYYSSRAFTMSLGGIRTPAPHNFYGTEAFNHSDRGIAMPTSIIPTIAGNTTLDHFDTGNTTTNDVFSFKGVGTQDQRSENLCGWRGFICGINPQVALRFNDCTTPPVHSPDDSGTIVFVNSAACPEFSDTPGPHFFLAVKVVPCPDTFCDKRNFYGLMEIVENPVQTVDSSDARANSDREFKSFKDDRQLALSASVPDKEGNGFYQMAKTANNPTGDIINYQIKQDRPHISSVNGKSLPQFSLSLASLTQGDLINSEGHGSVGNGKIVIKDPSPGGAAILTIDFTDALHPQLSPKPSQCQEEQPPVDTGHPVK